MSKDGYLPPGVEEWMIPGNRPEDYRYEKLLEEISIHLDKHIDFTNLTLEQEDQLTLIVDSVINDYTYYDGTTTRPPETLAAIVVERWEEMNSE